MLYSCQGEGNLFYNLLGVECSTFQTTSVSEYVEHPIQILAFHTQNCSCQDEYLAVITQSENTKLIKMNGTFLSRNGSNILEFIGIYSS
jgi:hypothetical protein